MATQIRVHATGGPEQLVVDEVRLAPPNDGEALVRHEAIGVNFIDTYHRSGLYPLPSLPHGIGQEAAGVVEEVGPGVTDVRPGDRVAYAGGVPGAYADRRVVRADRLVPVPPSVPAAVAAAVLLKGMTVEYLVHRAFRVERGATVLWHAAAGGVGSVACQWLSHLGVTVIGTVSTDEKAELARAHGCAHAVVYTRESFVERVREITAGAGVPVVYDSVGKTTFEGSLDCLARRGMLVGFGNASGAPPPFDPLVLARKGSLYMTRPTLFDYTASRAELLASASAVFDLVERGIVRAEPSRTFPLVEAAEAHRALESRATSGSVVLSWP